MLPSSAWHYKKSVLIKICGEIKSAGKEKSDTKKENRRVVGSLRMIRMCVSVLKENVLFKNVCKVLEL